MFLTACRHVLLLLEMSDWAPDRTKIKGFHNLLMTLFPLVFRLYFDQSVQTVKLKVEGLLDDFGILVRIDKLQVYYDPRCHLLYI